MFLFAVPRPHLSFEAQLVGGKSHEFGPISCPEQPDSPSIISAVTSGKQKHDAELKYPQRTRRLNIFPASKTEVKLFNLSFISFMATTIFLQRNWFGVFHCL